jgi:GAF domain-containing protein
MPDEEAYGVTLLRRSVPWSGQPRNAPRWSRIRLSASAQPRSCLRNHSTSAQHPGLLVLREQITRHEVTRPGVSGRSWCWDQRLGEGWVLTVVDLFVFGWGEVCAGGVQSAVVEPVDPLEGGDLDLVEGAPGAASVDQLGLEQPNLGLGQGVVVRVADAADAGRGAGFGEPLGEPDRGVLGDPASE